MLARVRRGIPWLATVGPVLTVADAGAVAAAGAVATDDSPATLVLGAVVAVLVARAADLHRPRLVLSIADDVPGLVVAAGAATVVLAGLGSAGLAVWVLALACLVLARTLVYAVTHVLRRSGRLGRRVLVVGTGPTARRLARTLLARRELGLRPVGLVGTGSGDPLDQARGLPVAWLGPVTRLPRAMTETGVDAVVVALGGPAGDDETAAVEGLLATTADLYAVAAWFPPVRAGARHPRELVDGIPVVRLHSRGAPLPVRAFKRLVEVLVALAALLVLVPAFTVLALLVKAETGGVLVRRPVVDEGGHETTRPRFRTRRARSVARPGTTTSITISGRIGPVGRILRRTRLVALPELVWAQLLRLRYAGGVPVARAPSSATPPRPNETQVDAGQLTR